MFKSKINLFGQNWIDTVFEERNKEYGAYEMRKKESGLTVRALIIGTVIFCLLVTLPMIVSEISKTIGTRKPPDERITVIELPPPPPPPDDVPEFIPPPPPKPPDIQEIKRLTQLVVAHEDAVIEEPPKQDDFKNAKAGSENIEADDTGTVIIEEPTKTLTVAPTEDKTVYTKESVQVEPIFPGGMTKFREYIMSGLEGRSFDISTNELRMQFRFVIEKDGKLTDIHVVDNGGSAEAAEMAVKVLGSCPRWTPAKIDGRSVRMLFTIPIIIKLL